MKTLVDLEKVCYLVEMIRLQMNVWSKRNKEKVWRVRVLDHEMEVTMLDKV